MGGRGSNNLFPKAQIDFNGEDNTRPNLWHDQFLLRLFDMPIHHDLVSTTKFKCWFWWDKRTADSNSLLDRSGMAHNL